MFLQWKKCSLTRESVCFELNDCETGHFIRKFVAHASLTTSMMAKNISSELNFSCSLPGRGLIRSSDLGMRALKGKCSSVIIFSEKSPKKVPG